VPEEELIRTNGHVDEVPDRLSHLLPNDRVQPQEPADEGRW